MSNKTQYSVDNRELPFFDKKGYFNFRIVSSDARRAIQLKPFPSELKGFFGRFEDCCVLGCCGIHALSFKPADKWNKCDTRWRYDSQVMRLLRELHQEAEQAPGDVVSATDFMMTFYKDDLLFFVDYLIVEMQESMQRG